MKNPTSMLRLQIKYEFIKSGGVAMWPNNQSFMHNKNIYYIKGRTIYYIPSKKTGYFVPKSMETKLSLMTNRYFFSSAFLVLLINIMPNAVVAVLVSLAICLGLELYYRLKFLPNLVREKHFVPDEKKGYIQSLSENMSKGRLMLRGIALIAFGILLVVNAYLSKFSATILTLNILTGIGCFVMAVIFFTTALKSKK